MIHFNKTTLLCGALLLAVPATNVLAGEARSGYDYIKPASRAMQDDDFENPGMLAVEQGRALFNDLQAGASKACADCHGIDGTKFIPASLARYPVYDEEAAEIVTLQEQISRCREANSGSQHLPIDNPDLVALETFVRNRAIGEPVNVQTDGVMVALLKAGEELYRTRYGLIDMACYQCHDIYPGQMIRGQKISQGQANGFPAYRLDTGTITTLNQRIQQCLTSMRAEPFAADSEEIRQLGLYLMSRSNGLKIETPAVRY
ncbi:MAG: sulfur oxidation c-type cytochrome SoxA [Gammaproteobacteria bacterium]|nr:sulfur oxidation c-type cytochrome SoxA [Gammaproteobacteria bacterium]